MHVDPDNHEQQALLAEVQRYVSAEVAAAIGTRLESLSASIASDMEERVATAISEALAPAMAKLYSAREGLQDVLGLVEKYILAK